MFGDFEVDARYIGIRGREDADKRLDWSKIVLMSEQLNAPYAIVSGKHVYFATYNAPASSDESDKKKLEAIANRSIARLEEKRKAYHSRAETKP
jgi:hypothetical protein